MERRIREAMEAGEFDDLPGMGAPIPDLDAVYDPAWWARKWVRRQQLLAQVEDLRREERRARRAVRMGEPSAGNDLARLEAEIARVDGLLPEADRS